MRSLDRVLCTLEHEEPDFVPLTDHIYMPRSLEGILGETGVRVDTPRRYIKVHRLLGLDLISAFADAGGTVKPKVLSADEEVDEWGVRNRIIDGMPWYLGGPIRSVEEFEDYEPPDPSLPERFRSTREIVRLVKGDLAIAGIVDGPFTRCWLLSGFDLFVKAIYLRPDSVRKLLERITRFIVDLGIGFIEVGVDLIWIPDDLGMVDGPFLSPSTFRRIIFPYLSEVVRAFKRRGVKVLLHSDGQIMPLMDDLVEIGFDGVHPIERKAGMNLEEMKARYGDKVTLIGNVDATEVLPHGEEEEIKKQVLECLEIAAPGGGYILASDHSIHEGVPSKNAFAMFRLARKYGRYPISINRK
ncbi:MAG: uroporphyrinogen decarboxylase family protein [Candidatus Bathyarchaeia archaeon]